VTTRAFAVLHELGVRSDADLVSLGGDRYRQLRYKPNVGQKTLDRIERYRRILANASESSGSVAMELSASERQKYLTEIEDLRARLASCQALLARVHRMVGAVMDGDGGA
jgi:hypothetical protein